VNRADTSEGSFSLDIAAGAPDDWPTLLSRDPAAEYTQTRHWTESVARHLDEAAALYVTLRHRGELVGGLNAVRRRLSRRILGLPVGYTRLQSSFEGTSGGPVVAADLPDRVRDRIFTKLVRAYAGQRHRLLGTCALVLSPAQEKRFGPVMGRLRGWVRQDTLTAVVSLAGGIDTVDRERLVMNKRNERNRGLRRGAEVFATTDPALFDQYYRIYAGAADHWGIEPVPVSLLQSLLRDEQGRVFFTCVRLKGEVIGGHLNLHFGDKVLAWNGVTDPRYAKTHFPATLCFWGDMVEACRRGAAWLDLGGSGQVKSLAGFKKYFGSDLLVRGLYTRDSLSARLLKKNRELRRNRRTGQAGTRWHDRVSRKKSSRAAGRDGASS
jgi:hypothetical protein